MKNEIKLDDLATKQDLRDLEKDLKKDISLLRKDFEIGIVHSRNQIILWISGLLVANGFIQHFL